MADLPADSHPHVPGLRGSRGQGAEFRVWAEIIEQSEGALHVFLPLLDRGVDGVVHNLIDGTYTAIQVKSRTVLEHGMVVLEIRERDLVADQALMIAVHHEPHGLGPAILVVTEGDFRRLARRSLAAGGPVLSAQFSMHPRKTAHWAPYVIPLASLGERLLGIAPSALRPPAALAVPFPPREVKSLGFLGEAEVVRRLAAELNLNLFRPFPDVEAAEVLVRDRTTQRFAGLQVKTASFHPLQPVEIGIRPLQFRPAPDLWIVTLAWLVEEARFHDECLLIPSGRLSEVTAPDFDHLALRWLPGSRHGSRLDPYRKPLADLGGLVQAFTQAQH